MPNWHDEDCDCAACRDDEERFWREQGGDSDDEHVVHLGFDGSFAPLDDDDSERPDPTDRPEPEHDRSW